METKETWWDQRIQQRLQSHRRPEGWKSCEVPLKPSRETVNFDVLLKEQRKQHQALLAADQAYRSTLSSLPPLPEEWSRPAPRNCSLPYGKKSFFACLRSTEVKTPCPPPKEPPLPAEPVLPQLDAAFFPVPKVR
eukprot:TRINITY_DN18030_c1_g2_i1.p1 TRINITY_DN18030_c1_g2~~TRINITY_DN18030_c1_g2_i1.p1  ORF type:complete len:151 (+),score=31.54 TRINITY_DN18030_c1_g2_i1:50-454(+)